MIFTSATLFEEYNSLDNAVCNYNKVSESLECFCSEGYFKVHDDKGTRCEKIAIAASGTDLKTDDNGEMLENVIGNENKSFGASVTDTENIKDQDCTNGIDCLKISEINSQKQIDINENRFEVNNKIS